MDDGKVTKVIKHVLTRDEVIDESELLAAEMAEVNELEREKKQAADNFKGKITEVQISMGERAKKIRNGYEMRSVECIPTPDYADKVMRFYTDDMELVDERPLTPDELQQRFEFEQAQDEALERTRVELVAAIDRELGDPEDAGFDKDEDSAA